MPDTIYDCLIVGGGPAGLSAAVYLGRFLRRTVVLDAGAGRSSGPQRNENYLGFPRGVKAARLRELGRAQAERFGVEFVQGSVTEAVAEGDTFLLRGDCREWRGRTVIIATGVTDIWPSFPHVQRYVGRSLFWCITCDGFRTRDKRLVLIGADEEAVTTACQFQVYTDKITFVATGVDDGEGLPEERLSFLREQGIEVRQGQVERVEGSRGQVRRLFVGDEPLEADLMFSLLGATPNASLASQLGVLVDSKGFVRVDREQQTNVPRVYVAGDLSGPYAHQVASAVHEGATAAQRANYDLYAEPQRE